MSKQVKDAELSITKQIKLLVLPIILCADNMANQIPEQITMQIHFANMMEQARTDNRMLSSWSNFTSSKQFKEMWTNNGNSDKPSPVWFNVYNRLLKYVNQNNSLPPKTKKYNKLNLWINTQNKNYKTKSGDMSFSNIYDTWTGFLSTYSHLF